MIAAVLCNSAVSRARDRRDHCRKRIRPDQRRLYRRTQFGIGPVRGAGWLAAGDASMSFDPLSAQGLLHALFGGLAAAEATNSWLAGDDDAVPRYRRVMNSIQQAYRRHFGFLLCERDPLAFRAVLAAPPRSCDRKSKCRLKTYGPVNPAIRLTARSRRLTC